MFELRPAPAVAYGVYLPSATDRGVLKSMHKSRASQVGNATYRMSSPAMLPSLNHINNIHIFGVVPSLQGVPPRPRIKVLPPALPADDDMDTGDDGQDSSAGGMLDSAHRGRKRPASEQQPTEPVTPEQPPNHERRQKVGKTLESGSMDVDPNPAPATHQTEALSAPSEAGRQQDSEPTGAKDGISSGAGAGAVRDVVRQAPSASSRTVTTVTTVTSRAAAAEAGLLPLDDLEKQATVDSLFQLMESGEQIGVLVWELLMKMPTNAALLNTFR